MDETKEESILTQAERDSNAEAFRETIRGLARQALADLVREEIDGLCGPAWHPLEASPHQRAGSAPSSVYVQGRKEPMSRPRVRVRDGDGTAEVRLETWKLAQDPGEWEDAMMRATLCGVSTRNAAALREREVRGESRSSLSRLWQRKAAELAEQMQTADLGGYDLLVLMVDAVVLADGLVATVALGIDGAGEKRILGFEVGSSENEQVCADLLGRLAERGLRQPAGRLLLAVLDGSKALRKAVEARFPRVVVQRCLVHKERNIRGYLPRKDWKALAGYFARLRRAQGEEAALEVCRELERFLAARNAKARESYGEAAGELLALHRLNVPATLNTSLLSTNSIENAFRNLRRHVGRVCRWRADTRQADLWMASGLALAQKGFRRIRGHGDLGELVRALERKARETQAAA